MTPQKRQPAGVPVGGQFAPQRHGEAQEGSLGAPGPQEAVLRLDAAYRAVNEAMMSEGMQVGPPSPSWREHSAIYDAAIAEATAALHAAAPELSDELAEVIRRRHEDHQAAVEDERSRLLGVVERAKRARSAVEGVDIIAEEIPTSTISGSILRRPTRAEAIRYAQERLERLHTERRFYVSGHDLAEGLDEPHRSWVREAPAKALQGFIDEAKRRAGVD